MTIQDLKNNLDILRFDLDIIAYIEDDQTQFNSYIVVKSEIFDESNSDSEDVDDVIERVIEKQIAERWHVDESDISITVKKSRQIFKGQKTEDVIAHAPSEFFN